MKPGMRMSEMSRTMIVMDAGTSRFQFRAGALIRCNGHILVHRAVTDPGWSLPGGRVEFHEAGAEALSREIMEETGRNARIGPLRFIIENFFALNGRRTHEVGFYYEAELDTPLPFHESGIVHRSRDGDLELQFRWALPTGQVLGSLDLKPTALIGLIEAMPPEVVHLVHRDVGA
jgi:8-oxo-dGTP pyrophosphatase MutT (NUDIX family)